LILLIVPGRQAGPDPGSQFTLSTDPAGNRETADLKIAVKAAPGPSWKDKITGGPGNFPGAAEFFPFSSEINIFPLCLLHPDGMRSPS